MIARSASGRPLARTAGTTTSRAPEKPSTSQLGDAAGGGAGARDRGGGGSRSQLLGFVLVFVFTLVALAFAHFRRPDRALRRLNASETGAAAAAAAFSDEYYRRRLAAEHPEGGAFCDRRPLRKDVAVAHPEGAALGEMHASVLRALGAGAHRLAPASAYPGGLERDLPPERLAADDAPLLVYSGVSRSDVPTAMLLDAVDTRPPSPSAAALEWIAALARGGGGDGAVEGDPGAGGGGVAADIVCAVPCRFSTRTEDASRADVHLTSGRDGGDGPEAAEPAAGGGGDGPMLALHQLAPAERYGGRLSDASWMSRFDVVASSVSGADVWVPPARPLFERAVGDDMTVLPDLSPLFCSLPAAREEAPAAYFGGGACGAPSGRDEYAAELAQYIEVDNFSPCGKFGTRRGLGSVLPPGEPVRAVFGDREADLRAAVASRYRFALVFEEEAAPDWVTSGVYRAFVSGSVPVYFGARNVAEFVPPGSVIVAGDFSTPAELASHLEHLARTPDAYNAYLRWRAEGRWTMTAKSRASPVSQFCGICLAAHAERARRADGSQRYIHVWDDDAAEWTDRAREEQ